MKNAPPSSPESLSLEDEQGLLDNGMRALIFGYDRVDSDTLADIIGDDINIIPGLARFFDNSPEEILASIQRLSNTGEAEFTGQDTDEFTPTTVITEVHEIYPPQLA